MHVATAPLARSSDRQTGAGRALTSLTELRSAARGAFFHSIDCILHSHRRRLEKQRYGQTAGRIKRIGEPEKGRNGKEGSSRESKSRYQNGNSSLEANERRPKAAGTMMGNEGENQVWTLLPPSLSLSLSLSPFLDIEVQRLVNLVSDIQSIHASFQTRGIA